MRTRGGGTTPPRGKGKASVQAVMGAQLREQACRGETRGQAVQVNGHRSLKDSISQEAGNRRGHRPSWKQQGHTSQAGIPSRAAVAAGANPPRAEA